jgi:cell division control protein 6
LSALLVRDYRSEARIGIKALEVLGRSNKWDEGSINTAMKQAYVEVKSEMIKSLGDRDPLILAALVKNHDTKGAYSEVSASSHLLVRGSEQVNAFPDRQQSAEPWPYHTDQEEDRQILYNGATNIII